MVAKLKSAACIGFGYHERTSTRHLLHLLTGSKPHASPIDNSERAWVSAG